jgi:L-alanine-DL-glutamate epimerase-like enolase superfamily enzyme
MKLTIKDIEVIWLDVPMTEISDRAMRRSYYCWRITEILRVTTDAGIVGYGETIPHYTWRKVSPEAIAFAKGKNPADLMWDDTLGAGLQMACFDLVGKAAGAPVHRLLGKQVRQWCPLSWWDMDMSPADYAADARRAVAAGYTSFKQKVRPWWDINEQVRLTTEATPAHFKLDMDFNETMVNASVAIPVLRRLHKYPNIAMIESPIVQTDIEGMRRVRAMSKFGLALHYTLPLMIGLRQDVYDGFVNYESVNRQLALAHIAQEANFPFFIQMVGTAWTTAMALHLGAVCTHAQWPAVTCLNIYADQLSTQPIEVRNGYAKVPEGPGMGLEFDERALRYRTDKPEKPNAEALYAFIGPAGEKTWYAGEQGPTGYWDDFMRGNQPRFEAGVRLESWDNDGSPEWRELAARTKIAPVRSWL